MIGIRLEGGLGNQLFQYAAGRALANRHAAPLVLDTTALFNVRRGVTSRRFELHHFHYSGRLATTVEARAAALLRSCPALTRWIGPWQTLYREPSLAFNPGFTHLPNCTYLVGYWQSYRYFESVAAQLHSELQPVQPLAPQSVAVAAAIDACTSVAVHVRRGDYLTLPSAAHMHGLLPLAYYIESVSYLRARIGSPKFFVFSDDPDWCQANLPLDAREVSYVRHNSDADSWQDLVLMSICRHHIIANSSFSWWGAWLADQRNSLTKRHVVAPARWFSGQDHDTRDRFPAHWVTCN